jgi:hypothetical protein
MNILKSQGKLCSLVVGVDVQCCCVFKYTKLVESKKRYGYL